MDLGDGRQSDVGKGRVENDLIKSILNVAVRRAICSGIEYQPWICAAILCKAMQTIS